MSKSKKILNRYKLYLLSFLLPLLVLTIIYIIRNITPFGNRTITIVDSIHQYVPFFSEYYYKLTHHENLFYTFHSGMGINFFALWAYYLSSPLNLLILLFKQEHINQAVCLIMTLKIALCGPFFVYYLEKKTYKNNPRILIFSTAYALSNYVIGFYWNVMWMDCIILLPIIIVGLEKLVKENNPKLYTITLFLSLFCNFYISFMICLFLVMYYFAMDFKGVKNFIKSGISFAFHSILAAAMAAVVLIPTYQALMKTSSAKMELPKPEWYTSFFDIFMAGAVGHPSIRTDNFDGHINLYCGVLSMLLIMLYIFHPKLSIRKKLVHIGIMMFIAISFNLTTLNYIWHGFHNQYGIPNRFSFLYIFLMLIMSGEVLQDIRKYKPFHIGFSYLATMVFVIASYFLAVDRQKFAIYAVTMFLLCVYAVVLLLYINRTIKTKVVIAILFAIQLLELGGNSIVNFGGLNGGDLGYYYEEAPKVKELVNGLEQEEFYRIEMNKAKVLDESTYHNLNSVGIFGSTARGSVVTTMGNLGFYSAANEYLYRGNAPVTNALLGVKYLIVRKKEANYSEFTHVKNDGDLYLYENENALPLGFMVEDEIVNLEYTGTNPFIIQNNFLSAAIAETQEVYSIFYQDSIEGAGASIEETSNGECIFTRDNTQMNEVTYTYNIEEDMDMYIHYVGSQASSVLIKIDDIIRANERIPNEIIHVGKVGQGQTVTLTFRLKEDKETGVIRVKAAGYKEEMLKSAVAILRKNSLKVKVDNPSKFTGTIDTNKAGYLLTTIPYDEGFTVTVDDQPVKTYKIADAFLAIRLGEGSHTIKFSYVPEGFKEGAIISLCGLLIFIVMCVLEAIGHRKGRDIYDARK